MITGLDVFALEVFEQDMVGVKGYDTTVLEALKRHAVRIVAKSSNANTITHYVDASLKSVRRVEAEIARSFPSARIHVQRVSLVSVVGRSLEGLSVMLRGLTALDAAGIAPIASHQNGRRVDVQFVVAEEQKLDSVRALHRALVEQQATAAKPVPAVAAA
jgi:aspartate kinase